jgi:hypothetical protein
MESTKVVHSVDRSFCGFDDEGAASVCVFLNVRRGRALSPRATDSCLLRVVCWIYILCNTSSAAAAPTSACARARSPLQRAVPCMWSRQQQRPH